MFLSLSKIPTLTGRPPVKRWDTNVVTQREISSLCGSHQGVLWLQLQLQWTLDRSVRPGLTDPPTGSTDPNCSRSPLRMQIHLPGLRFSWSTHSVSRRLCPRPDCPFFRGQVSRSFFFAFSGFLDLSEDSRDVRRDSGLDGFTGTCRSQQGGGFGSMV